MITVPHVSVLLPVYNAARFLAVAIESILAQSHRDFELIVIDDGSKDRSVAILHGYAARDPRINLLSRPNTGIVRALNDGLTVARGELIARMDADDISLPHRFQTQVAYLEAHPDCVMLGSRVIVIDPGGRELTIMGDALTHEEIDGSLMIGRGQMVYHPSVIMRRGALLDVGGYRTDYPHAEDLDLFLRLAESGRIVNLPEPLLKYREHFHKVGHLKSLQQMDSCRRAIRDAHLRRGLDVPPEIENFMPRPPTAAERQRTWGWWALANGHVHTSRKHAVGSLLKSPAALEAWKLLFCSIRGR